MVTGAGRVVDLLEQGVKFLLVAQGKSDGQIQTLRARKTAGGSHALDGRRHMAAAQFLPGRCDAGQGKPQYQQRDDARHAQGVAVDARVECWTIKECRQ